MSFEAEQHPASRPTRGLVNSVAQHEPDDGEHLYLPQLVDADWEELISAWAEVSGSLEQHLWALGEIAANVERKYGTNAISKFASEVGYSARRVYELAQTYTTWRNLRPSQILSHKHHTIAARDEEPEALIEVAETEEWSTRELKEHVKERREAAEGKPEPAPVATRMCPTCAGSGSIPVDGVAETRTEAADG